jgi:hypothetical protein
MNGIIKFRCLRSDGRHESTKLEHINVDQAHVVAERILQIGNSLYTEVEISTESGRVETVHKHDAIGATSSKGLCCNFRWPPADNVKES